MRWLWGTGSHRREFRGVLVCGSGSHEYVGQKMWVRYCIVLDMGGLSNRKGAASHRRMSAREEP